jgi:type I restriction enzyme S subunit
MLEAGDLLMTAAGTIGKSFTFKETYPACYAGYLVRFRPARKLVHGRYVAYWMQSAHYWAQVDSHSVKSTIENFSASKYGELSLLLPPLPVQRAIADYLDTETVRIDALIAKKSALAARMDERLLGKTRSLVGGGLEMVDPLDVKQEELAAGWRSLRLGRHLAFGSGTTPTSGDPRFYGPGVPWIVTADLRDRELTHVGRSVTEAALAEFSALKVHPPGSLVVAMYGATVGRLGLTTFPAAVNQACCVIRMRDEVDLRFVFFYLLANRSALLERCVGAGQPNISQDILRSLSIAVPDVAEQSRIAEDIVDSRRRNQVVLERLGQQVELLQAHRQALITAAVTGESDVSRPA